MTHKPNPLRLKSTRGHKFCTRCMRSLPGEFMVCPYCQDMIDEPLGTVTLLVTQYMGFGSTPSFDTDEEDLLRMMVEDARRNVVRDNSPHGYSWSRDDSEGYKADVKDYDFEYNTSILKILEEALDKVKCVNARLGESPEKSSKFRNK